MIRLILALFAVSAVSTGFIDRPVSVTRPIAIQMDSVIAEDSSEAEISLENKLIAFAEKYLGTPYGYGSNSTSRFDCSGYVRHCFSHLKIELPHSSAAQAAYGEKVSLKDVKRGDLLFFKGRSTKKKSIGHVAMVYSNEDGVVKMIHASTSRGVIIETYNGSEYYTKRFVEARRLIDNSKKDKNKKDDH